MRLYFQKCNELKIESRTDPDRKAHREFLKMNIRIVSYFSLGRHAEFISASITANYLDFDYKTLKFATPGGQEFRAMFLILLFVDNQFFNFNHFHNSPGDCF